MRNIYVVVTSCILATSHGRSFKLEWNLVEQLKDKTEKLKIPIVKVYFYLLLLIVKL